MTPALYTIHALDRAKERYGLDLTGKDATEIQRRCINGEACLVHHSPKSGSTVYTMIWDGIRIFPTITPAGILVTFQISEYLKAGQRVAHYKTKEKRQTPKWMDGAPRARRPKTARQYLAEAMEEEG